MCDPAWAAAMLALWLDHPDLFRRQTAHWPEVGAGIARYLFGPQPR